MRILFDSQKEEYKTPFGCVTRSQPMTICVHIPVSVEAVTLELVVEKENGESYVNHHFQMKTTENLYQRWQCDCTISDPGLYFYYFRITGKTGTFRLFKQGNHTNMEAGDKWQLSCIRRESLCPGGQKAL